MGLAASSARPIDLRPPQMEYQPDLPNGLVRFGRSHLLLLLNSLQGSEVRAPIGPAFAFRNPRARRAGPSTRPFARGARRAPAKPGGVGTRRSDLCRNPCGKARCGRPRVRLLQKSLQGWQVRVPTGPTFAFRNQHARRAGPPTRHFARGADRAPAKVAGVGTRRSDPCRNPCKTRRYERPRVRLLQKSTQDPEVRVPTGPTFAFRDQHARRAGPPTRPFARGARRAPAKVAGVGAHGSDLCREPCRKARCGRPRVRLLQNPLQRSGVRLYAYCQRCFSHLQSRLC